MLKIKRLLTLVLLAPVLVLRVDILTYDVVCRKSTMQEDEAGERGERCKDRNLAEVVEK